MPRIHVMGASGAGTTTLGASLARALGVTHADSDSFFWLPTDPPFQTPRPVADRIAVAADTLRPDRDWVLSGSALKWGERFEPLYHLIVFVRLDPQVRMARIKTRERERYGARLSAGGDMEKTSAEFLAWAEAYDTAGVEQRSLLAHEQWLARQPTLVLRVNSEEPVEAMTQQVLTILDECA